MKGFQMVLAIFAAGFLAGCPDDDTCNDCSCDPSLCDGGGDADADADSDGDADGETTATATLHIETWTISSDGTRRDLPGADAEVEDGQHCTTPCDLELPVGDHELSLTLAGWVQGPNPLPISLISDSVIVNREQASAVVVETEGFTLRHRLERDLSGTWRSEDGGTTAEPSIWTGFTGSYSCPDTGTSAGPFDPVGSLCIEGEILSLCKTHASECSGDWAEGRVLENGQRLEFTFHYMGGTAEASFVYLKE